MTALPPLAGRTAVVTGTAQGIGRAIADRLQDAGAAVRGVDRDEVDLADTEQVEAFFAALGDVDVLVNCAGGVVGQTHTPVDELSDDAWDAVVAANVTTMRNCTRAAARSMKRRGFGRIVTISSGAGRSVSLTGVQAYTTAKAAQIGFTRQMAHELGPFGITANCIAPGSSCPTPRRRPSGTPTGPRASRPSWNASRSAARGRRTTSPAASCSSPTRARPGSAGRPSRSTAGTPSSEGPRQDGTT